MNREESARIAKLAWAGFPHCTLDEFAIESFHITLSDVAFQEAFEATRQCLREEERRHPPTHGEIIGAVKRIRRERARLAAPIEDLPDIDPAQAKNEVERFWQKNPHLKKIFGV